MRKRTYEENYYFNQLLLICFLFGVSGEGFMEGK